MIWPKPSDIDHYLGEHLHAESYFAGSTTVPCKNGRTLWLFADESDVTFTEFIELGQGLKPNTTGKYSRLVSASRPWALGRHPRQTTA
jgi:hypothetical protein